MWWHQRPEPLAAGGNVTASPSTVAAIGAVPAPTVKGAAVATPSTVAAVASVPSPVLASNNTTAPSTVAAVAAVPAPTVAGAARPTPSSVAAVAAVPAPTVQANAIAQAQGQGTSPDRISSLGGWWDFGDASTIFEDTGRTDAAEADDEIAGVTDKSSVGNHLSQPTAGLRPIWKTGILNGRAISRSDGTADYLDAADATSLSEWTLVVVMRPSDGTDNGYIVQMGNTTSRYALISGFVDGRVEWFGQSTPAVERVQMADTDTANFHSYVVSRPVHSGTVATYTDGTPGPTTATQSLGTTVTRAVRMHANRALGSDYWPGDIAAVAIFDRALTAIEIAEVHRFLAVQLALNPGPATTVQAIASIPAPTITVTAGGDAAATPSTVAAVASVPSPTIAGTAVATPSTVAAVSAVPAPTVAGAARPTPSTVVAVASVPAPTVAGAARPTPATVVSVAVVPAPTVRAAAIASPATVVGIALVPAPTILVPISQTVTPATVVAIARVGAPTIIVPVFTEMVVRRLDSSENPHRLGPARRYHFTRTRRR